MTNADEVVEKIGKILEFEIVESSWRDRIFKKIKDVVLSGVLVPSKCKHENTFVKVMDDKEVRVCEDCAREVNPKPLEEKEG